MHKIRNRKAQTDKITIDVLIKVSIDNKVTSTIVVTVKLVVQ